jgi:type IV pilus biogenesis protein PilP
MNMHLKKLALVFAAVTSVSAFAAPFTTNTAPVPVDQIPVLLANEQAQTALLAAKAVNAKFRSDIRQSESSGNGAAPAVEGLGGLGEPLAKARKEPSEQLMFIAGADGSYRATISVDGRTTIAEVGDTLSDGWRVAAITGSTVSLSKGKQQRTLRI